MPPAQRVGLLVRSTTNRAVRAGVTYRRGPIGGSNFASAMLATLGCPPRAWGGTIAIVGREDDEGITPSLTAEQLDLVAKAHRLARATA